ncbi:ArsR family transcriptional regulator [Dyella sp. C9]|uniref:ArsR/SmtB family transcription factor n=1 Tax=Dyella sp. C9 TaxID=2202154 RepID=UPI000DEEDF47|nr:ArsR family transcriptional regulator [Dyella sp. C9]
MTKSCVSIDALAGQLAALASPQRLRIVGALTADELHVSELARRLGMSRPLLYAHLARLEEAGILVGRLELSKDGKALKYFKVVPFQLKLDAKTIRELALKD